MLKAKQASEQQTWDQFVQSFRQASFLQSWNWGQFREKKGGTAFYLFFEDEETPVGASLIILDTSARGGYLECIGGPLFRNAEERIDKDYFAEWLRVVRDIADEHDAGYLRLRLPYQDSKELREILEDFGLRETTLYYQAELTRLINLSPSVDELLSSMKKNTRYEVRRAEREGVSVKKYTSDDEWEDSFEVFISLYEQMVERQDFVGYTPSYLKQQFELFCQDGQATLYVAHYENRPVAASIFFHYADTITYHHSASIPFSKFSPQSLIIWEAMKDAKERGHDWIDLFGIAPPGKRYESRIGLTKFKEGFGGQEWAWARTYDLPYSLSKYLFSSFVESLPMDIRSFGAKVVRGLKKLF